MSLTPCTPGISVTPPPLLYYIHWIVLGISRPLEAISPALHVGTYSKSPGFSASSLQIALQIASPRFFASTMQFALYITSPGFSYSAFRGSLYGFRNFFMSSCTLQWQSWRACVILTSMYRNKSGFLYRDMGYALQLTVAVVWVLGLCPFCKILKVTISVVTGLYYLTWHAGLDTSISDGSGFLSPVCHYYHFGSGGHVSKSLVEM